MEVFNFMSQYIPNTEADRRAMLDAIGVASIDELFSDIPAQVRLAKALDLPEALSEPELARHLRALSGKNRNLDELTCFLGAGSYDHFIPAAVDTIVSRGEFTTSYTPYQPEAAQGTLQAIFEYQTMVCELTGMEVSNASMYDGATAAAEAMVIAAAETRRARLLVACSVNPETVRVLGTYCWSRGYELTVLPCKNGRLDRAALSAELAKGDVAALLLQTPSFFGVVEDLTGLADELHAAKALLIVSTDLLALGCIKAPGELGADIVVGDGQSVGNSVSFGGPAFGFMAATKKLMRKMPGRIVGRTKDIQGRDCYVLTLQAREQHIRREKATSNICSNQNLCIVAASVYLSLMGPQGLREVDEQILAKTAYAVDALVKTGKFRPAFAGVPAFREVALICDEPVASLNARLLEAGILGGLDLSKSHPELGNAWLLAVTEQRTKEEIDRLVSIAAGGDR